MKYKEYVVADLIKPEPLKIYLRIEDDGSQSVSCSEDDEDFKEYSTTEIDPQGVDYAKLTPLLTAALQEAITKIETLEAEVAALKSS